MHSERRAGAHATPTKENRSDTPYLQAVAPAERAVRKPSRRGRKPTIDAIRVWEAADVIEQMVGPGFHLAHTHRMGWLLRQLESWPDWRSGRSWKWVDVDSAPDGQLAALLLRHQERQRKAPPSD